MKKIINLLFFVFLMLISMQCQVENLEPVEKVIENNGGESRLIYSKIHAPFKYKTNTYFIKIPKGSKIEFLKNNELRFIGEIIITQGNKNARLAKSTIIPDGSVVYITTDEDDVAFELEFSGGSEINGSYHYKYEVADPYQGINAGKVSYKTTHMFKLSFTISKKVAGSDEDIKNSKANFYVETIPDASITYTTETTEEIVNGRLISGNKIETFNFKGEIRNQYRGKLNTVLHKGTSSEKEIKITVIEQEFKPIPIPATPIVITPKFEFGIEASGEAEVKLNYRLINGEYNSTVNYEVENGDWFKKKSDVIKKIKILDDVDGSIEGNIKMGVYVKIITQINKFEIPFIKKSISAGEFEFKIFGYGKLTLENCEEEGGPIVEGGLDFSGGYTIGIIDAEGKRSTLVPPKEIKFPELSVTTEIFKIPFISCTNNDIIDKSLNDLSPTYFKKYLKEHNFPLIEGNTPLIIDGEYQFNPNILVHSNLQSDLILNGSLLNKKFGNANFYISNNGKILTLDQTNFQNRALTTESTGDFLGNNNNALVSITSKGFTIIALTDGVVVNNGIEYLSYVALTVLKEGNEIKGKHYAIYRIQNTKSNDTDIPIKTIRIFKDRAQLA